MLSLEISVNRKEREEMIKQRKNTRTKIWNNDKMNVIRRKIKLRIKSTNTKRL